MRFLSPLALFGLVLIGLPVAIHLLVRRRAQRLDFPSLRFLREKQSFRLRPRHIQQPLLLALRVAAIACLVLGLSQPLFSPNTKTSRAHVILLDASLSMRAVGRTEAAREQAVTVISGLAAGERAAIIEFSTESLVLSEMTGDKSKLREALFNYRPASGATSYAAGLMAAEALLQSERTGEAWIDIVSDFQSSGLSRENLAELDGGLIQRAKIITHPVGAELGVNAFLVGEKVYAGASFAEIAASEIVVSNAERSGTRKRWTVESNDADRIDAAWHRETNGQTTARIRTVTPDEFDDDDERFLVISSPRKCSALLIERPGEESATYLRAALDATAADLGDKNFRVETMASLPDSATDLGAYSLLALTLDGNPRSDELRVVSDYARNGGTVWLCLGTDLNTTTWNEFVRTENGRSLPFAAIERKSNPRELFSFGLADSDAPALRSMSEELKTSLRSIRMKVGFSVTPRNEAATIMRWNDGTVAFVSEDVGNGRLVLLATSPSRAAGDLGASAAFPALASSIAKLSVTQKEPIAREVGQPISLGLASSDVIKVVDPGGRVTTGQARDLITRAAVYFPVPGIFRVEANGITTFVAINAPAAESQPSLASATEIERIFKTLSEAPETRVNVSNNSTELDRAAWRVLFFGGFLLLIVEMWISIKRRGEIRT